MADKIRCDVTGYIFSSDMVRQCREPAVVRRYGTGGFANVSVYVCKKCKHGIHMEFFDGVKCGLEQGL